MYDLCLLPGVSLRAVFVAPDQGKPFLFKNQMVYYISALCRDGTVERNIGYFIAIPLRCFR
jgi:hypothetical protein